MTSTLLSPSPQGFWAKNLGKTYGKRPILKGVSLRVNQGEAVGLLGPNGAGKTTCFAMMCGLVRPDYGSIFLEDQDITFQPMYQRARLGIGYLPQESSIFRHMTVEQNIRCVLELRKIDAQTQAQEIDRLLNEFSMSHLRQAPSVSLSGGERRRVEIARALANVPLFLLLDEPFAGIDPIAVNEIRELIVHLKQKKIGVLITDHNVRETLDIVDRAYILHHGEILMEGSPQDIIASKEVRRVYLGERFSLYPDS